MKLVSVFRKSMKEQTRDILVLSLSLVFAPFFVLLYWLFFPGGSTTYGVLVINHDEKVQLADGLAVSGGDDVIEIMKEMTYASEDPLLEVIEVTGRANAEILLRDRDAEVLVIIPAGFSRALLAARQGDEQVDAPVTLVGDLTNPYYAVAAVMANAALEEYVTEAAGLQRPIQIREEALGASAARSEFEVYVPGLLVFSVVMLIFQASMVIAREVEAGTLRRLQITRMTSVDFLGGVSLSVVLVGVASVLLTFLTAWALGFHSQGPLWVAIAVGAVTSISIVGAGLIVAALSKTVNQAFLIANFPLTLFMFFSGAIYPLPRVPLFTVSGRVIGLYDILPPTHAVVALNKVLTLGVGLREVAYELVMLVVLSVTYLAAGTWLFQRTHMRAE